MKWIAMVAVLLLAGGCGGVTSPTIVGETPLNIQDTISQWEGLWMTSEPAMNITVVNATNGVIKVELIGGDNNQGKQSNDVYLVYLRECGGWTFATISPAINEESPDKEYVWGRLLHTGQQCTLWSPDRDKFRALVSIGVILGRDAHATRKEGEIEKRLRLGELGTNHLALIASGTLGVLFDWENPLVVYKARERAAAIPASADE